MSLIAFLTFKHSGGNVRNRMLQSYATLFRGLNVSKTCKTLGFMQIIVCLIPPWGEAKPYLSYGLKGIFPNVYSCGGIVGSRRKAHSQRKTSMFVVYI